MAGIGSAWGSREELLHPRDRHGRFRKKWKMAAEAVGRLTKFLDAFQPRSFQSDQQAAQFAFNARKAPWTTPELRRLHMDWDEANESLQAGEMDDTTKKFVDMMDRNMVETTDDLIVSQTVPVEAFGLNPQQAAQEDGGLEDFIGLEIADAGYTATNLGSELSHPPGSVTLRVAVPKGTRVAYGGRSPNDRGLILDRDQPLIVTKVEPDGRGGWYVLAVAGSGKRTKGATAVADDRTFGRRGAGLTPQQREARINPQMSGESRLKKALEEQQQNEAATLAHQQQVQGKPAAPAESAPAPTPAPAAPASPQTPASPATGVPERREPVLKDAVGPGSPEGKSPSDIASEADAAAKAQAEAPPAPAAPPSPDQFRDAAKDLPMPSAGAQRREWKAAYDGILRGNDPGDTLRELESDIGFNKSRLSTRPDWQASKDEKEANIKSQEDLADLISQQYNLPRKGQGGPAPTPGAPSTQRESVPSPEVQQQRALDKMTKPELLAEAGDAGHPRMTKDQLRQVIEAKRTGAEAPLRPSPRKSPTKRAPAKKAAAKAAPEEAPGDRAGLERRLSGEETRSEMRKRTAGPGLSDEEKADVQAKAERVNKRIEAERADQDAKNEADLAPLLESAGLQRDDLDEMDQTGAHVILGNVRDKKISKVEGVRRLKASNSPRLKALGEALGAQPRKTTAKKAAAKAVPEVPTAPAPAKVAKAVAKKAAPAKAVPAPDAAEEAFKARVAEAGLPDKVADLRDMARGQKIRGFSTMNKKQLQSALLGDEVPRAGKIAPVTPRKLVPHLEAADSDQAARALLDSHTLPDLKELAKHRELEIPKRGATKDRLKDMILTDIRGEQEGITGRSPDTSLEEDLSNLGYISLPGDRGDAINAEIDQANPDSAEALRRHRDNLEGLSKQYRQDGDKDAANMAQAAADAMGMRAQTISGVEEAAPPVKRVAKKAAPALPEGEEAPEVERPLEKMLKPELLDLAQKEGASVRPSWSKAKIVDEIKRSRRLDSSRGPETAEERTRRELGQLPGGPERDLGPTQGPLRLPDRAPTPEEIARDNPEVPAPAKKATKKAAKKAVDRAADTISGQLKETFGDQLRQEDPDSVRDSVRAVGLEPKGNTSEEIFDNALKDMLENRMRELGMLPEDPKKPTRAQKRVPKGSVKGPKADVPITTEGRRSSFTEAWDDQGFVDDPSLNEVRDRVASGDLTHEEGVRRIESEISFNEEEISDLGAELRGMSPEDRDPESGIADGIHARRAELQDKITSQQKAAKFLRDYSRDEAPVTQEELEAKLDGPDKAALQRVEVDDLKAAAKAEGLGDIEGDDKNTVIQNIARKLESRELANREKEQAARDLQADKDKARTHGEAIAGIESVLDGSDRAVTARIKSQSKVSGLSPELRDEMLAAAGDRDALRGILDRVARENGLRRIDARGQNTHFDPERHEQPPGANLQRGDAITVLQPGFRADVRGHDVQVSRAKVTAGHSPVVESLAPETPSGSQTGEQILSRREARLAKLADPQKKTVSASRLQPGERLRVAQTENGWHSTAKKTGSKEITVTRIEKVSGNDYVIHGRDDDGNDITLGSLFGQNVVHRAGPAAPPKATKKAAKAAEPDLTRDMEVLQQGRRVDNPEGVADRAEARKVAKAAVPVKATPKPVVDLDNPTRHDAEVIGTGLDLDPKGEDRQWLDVVQRDLDRGTDGRQIADGLRREADSQRTIHNIQENVGGTEGSSPAARINRMELMADRLEGVRPIKKAAPPAPAKAAGPAKRDMDTMQAASAQSDALADLRNGKSPTEVATKLRQRATSVGSREHDPQTVRPLEFTPSERSAMKRNDAKKLRELAAEIQAQGVAQRAEARAAKKAAPKKARPSASDDAVATLLMDRIAERDPAVAKAVLAEISPEDRKELDAARERDTARKAAKKAPSPRGSAIAQAREERKREGNGAPVTPAPKKRTAAEMRRAQTAAEMNGISVEEQLQRFDQQKEDRKNLTGPIGEMIQAQLDDAMRRLQAANGEGEERDALAGLLRPELAQLAQRLGLKPDRAKSIMINEIRDRVKGREAPGASAERAVPKVEAPSGVNESEPLTNFPHDDNMRMHADSPIMQTAFAYEKAGRNGSANRMAKLRAQATTPAKEGRLTPQQVVDELKTIRAQETDPKFQRMLDRAIEANDAPMTPIPELPADTPPLARKLMEDLHAIPYARKGAGSESAAGLIHGPSLVEQLAEVYRDAARGERGPERRHPVDRIRQILRSKVHEMNDPSFRIWELTKLFESDESSDTGKKVTELEKQIRDWERSHWPK